MTENHIEKADQPAGIVRWFVDAFRLSDRDFRQGRFLSKLPPFLRNRLIRWTQQVLAGRRDHTTDPNESREINRRLSQFEVRNQTERVLSRPKRIYFEITRKCNLRCQMCPHSFLDLDRSDIELSLLDSIAEVLPYNEDMALFGCGESLTSPVFMQALSRLPKELNTRLITNGILLNEENARLLVQHQLSACTVSIDAAKPETYQFIHGVDKFHQVIENIETLNRVKKELNSDCPTLVLGYVVMKANLDQVPDFIRLAARLRAASAGVGHLSVFRESLKEQSLIYHREEANRVFEQARKVADELGFCANLPEPFDLSVDPWHHQFPTIRGLCPEPWEFMYVDNVGTVRPCCLHEQIVGDLHKQSFEEIWNGDAYRKFRAVVNTPERYGMCLRCFDYRYRIVDNPDQYFCILAP